MRVCVPVRAMQMAAAMKTALGLLSLALVSCATVSGSTGEVSAVDVEGHVTACGAAPLASEPVTLWAAGELEAVETVQTLADGSFRFSVPSGDVMPSLFIEARGTRVLAKPHALAKNRLLVAELKLPCDVR